jgi:hypothetical protein
VGMDLAAVVAGPARSGTLAVPKVDVRRRIGKHFYLSHVLVAVESLIFLDLFDTAVVRPLTGASVPIAVRLALALAAFAAVAVPIKGRSVALWALALGVYALSPRWAVWRPAGPPRPVVVRRRGGVAACALGWLLWGVSYLPIPTPAAWAGTAVTADDPETPPPPPRRTFGPQPKRPRGAPPDGRA